MDQKLSKCEVFTFLCFYLIILNEYGAPSIVSAASSDIHISGPLPPPADQCNSVKPVSTTFCPVTLRSSRPNSCLTSCPLLACVDSPRVFAGTSTPPSIAATPVPALPPPIAVNSYASVPAPPNGQSATEALYTNGVHAYQGTAVLLSVLRLGCIGNNRVAETKDPSSRGPPF